MSINLRFTSTLTFYMQAGIVGSAGPTARQPVVSSETFDKATCLYENEWQIVDVKSLQGSAIPALPAKRVLPMPLQRQQRLNASIFLWLDSRQPENSQSVGSMCQYEYLLVS